MGIHDKCKGGGGGGAEGHLPSIRNRVQPSQN